MLHVVSGCELFSGLSVDQEVLLTHGDSIEELAECCHAIAHSGSLIAAIQHNSLPIYGLQFHPEVDLTDNGADMMRNFLYNVNSMLTLQICMCIHVCVCVFCGLCVCMLGGYVI